MLNRFRNALGAIVIGAALSVGGLGVGTAQAVLSPDLAAAVNGALSSGSDAVKVQAIVDLAQANPDAVADIAAAAATADPNLADEMAGQLAALLSDQDAKNDLVRSVCMALGDTHEDIALEVCTQVVAAVSGSEGVLEELIQTAAGGAFGDPVATPPGEPVGQTFQNQTSAQIPFYRERFTRSNNTTSPFKQIGDKGEPAPQPEQAE